MVAGLEYIISDGLLVVRERPRVHAAEFTEEIGSGELVR